MARKGEAGKSKAGKSYSKGYSDGKSAKSYDSKQGTVARILGSFIPPSTESMFKKSDGSKSYDKGFAKGSGKKK